MNLPAKRYENSEITVFWKPKVCVHSGNCFRKLMPVFDPRRKPWMILENGSTEAIIDAVKICPSGALSYRRNDDSDQEVTTNSAIPIIQVSASGPLIIKTGCILEDTHGNQTTQDGIVALCRCGASSNKPYCDGSHRKSGFSGE